MGKAEADSVKRLRRRVGYVCGQWRVAYVSSDESGGESAVRHGMIVGPLVSVSATIWVAVVPDGSKRHALIHRDAITHIAPPRPRDDTTR